MLIYNKYVLVPINVQSVMIKLITALEASRKSSLSLIWVCLVSLHKPRIEDYTVLMQRD